MIIKEKNNWDFTLYEVEFNYILSVVFFNSMVDFSRSFRFNKNEIILDFEKLKVLSEDIRSNYENYKEREISSIRNEDDCL